MEAHPQQGKRSTAATPVWATMVGLNILASLRRSPAVAAVMNAAATLPKAPSCVAVSKLGPSCRAWPAARPAASPQAMPAMAAAVSARRADALGPVGALPMSLFVTLMRSNLDKIRLRGLWPFNAAMLRPFPESHPDDRGTSGSITEEQDCHGPVVLVDEGISDG
jgi:hypothetical protein